MAVCFCSLAGTAACQHCSQNPFATDVWTNKTVTVAHFNTKPTNADRIRSMTDEELSVICEEGCPPTQNCYGDIAEKYDEMGIKEVCQRCWLNWLKQEATDGT